MCWYKTNPKYLIGIGLVIGSVIRSVIESVIGSIIGSVIGKIIGIGATLAGIHWDKWICYKKSKIQPETSMRLSKIYATIIFKSAAEVIMNLIQSGEKNPHEYIIPYSDWLVQSRSHVELCMPIFVKCVICLVWWYLTI